MSSPALARVYGGIVHALLPTLIAGPGRRLSVCRRLFHINGSDTYAMTSLSRFTAIVYADYVEHCVVTCLWCVTCEATDGRKKD